MRTAVSTSHPVVANRLDSANQLGVAHRFAAYAGGLAFGFVSFIGWRAIMATEFSATADHYVVLTPSLRSVFQVNSLSLLLWLAFCLGVTTAILYLSIRVRRYDRMIHEVANTDFVTEAYTHRFLMETMRFEAARANRYGRRLCMLVIGLDRLEGLRGDALQAAHDPMLQWLVKLSKALFRNVDVVCRYGKDCVAVILPEAPASGGLIAAERIRAAADREAASGNSRWASPISVGIVENTEPVKTAEDMLVACDVALFHSRSGGGNQVSFYAPDLEKGYRIDARRLDSLMHDGGLSSAKELAIVIDAVAGSESGHSTQVARYSLAIGRHLGLPKEQLTNLKTAALLHDVGKIAAPRAAAGSSGSTPENHSIAGSRILTEVPDLTHLASVVRAHEEHFDGSGIPDQLSRQEIPMFARIIAVAHHFVAMTCRQAASGSADINNVLTELTKDAGTKLDPVLVGEFAEAVSSNILWETPEAAA